MTVYQLIENVDQRKSRNENDSVIEFVLKRKTIKAIGRLYHDLDLTVRDICHLYDFEYKAEYQKLFYKLYGPKNQGHGGSRKGKSIFK